MSSTSMNVASMTAMATIHGLSTLAVSSDAPGCKDTFTIASPFYVVDSICWMLLAGTVRWPTVSDESRPWHAPNPLTSRCFEQEPNTALRLIDPVLKETRCRYVACVVAKAVNSAHA